MKSAYIGVSVSLGLLVLAGLGAGGWYVYSHLKTPVAVGTGSVTGTVYTTMPVPAPAGVSLPVFSASGQVVTSIPSSAAVGVDTAAQAAQAAQLLAQQTAANAAAAARIAAEQAAKEAEWRRTDKIQALQRELDGVWNQIKINDTQIQTIEGRSVPPGMYQQVKDELYKACMATKGWFFAGLQCDSEVPESRIQDELKSRWSAQLAAESRPYRASNSELDSRQRSLIANLAELGMTVSPVLVRGTV